MKELNCFHYFMIGFGLWQLFILYFILMDKWDTWKEKKKKRRFEL